jgi:hypothetical protein
LLVADHCGAGEPTHFDIPHLLALRLLRLLPHYRQLANWHFVSSTCE